MQYMDEESREEGVPELAAEDAPEGGLGALESEMAGIYGEGAEGATDLAGARALKEAGDKYLRLYAEFENFRKRVARDKQELLNYAGESLVYDLLTTIDNLDAALKHATPGAEGAGGLVQGVEMTLRELVRTLEKAGLKAIESVGRPFDPSYHHAVQQAERADMDPGMVADEFRKGYMFKDRVLRPAMVIVSKPPAEARAVEAEEIMEEESIDG